MVLIYQPPNAHVRISGILLRNAMAAAAVKKIYTLNSIDIVNYCDHSLLKMIIWPFLIKCDPL
jgi:hypothetical protein